MSRRERLAWWAVCIVPKFLARWLMWGKGQWVPLPQSWPPYLFGRALGVDGSRCQLKPASTDALARANTEKQVA